MNRLKVQSPDKLAGVNVGDTVESFTYAEAIAMKVEPAPKK